MAGTWLGRANITNCLSSISMVGDVLELSGWFSEPSLPESIGRRQQLLGLGVDEERIISVVSDLDSSIDGYYLCQPVRIETDHALSYEESEDMTGAHQWSATLMRVSGGYARPQVETVATSAIRTNAHGVAAALGIIGAQVVPTIAGAQEVDLGDTYGSTTLATEDGTITVWTASTTPVAPFAWNGYVAPADFFTGCARLEVLRGTEWVPVVGRQLDAGVAGNWRISNGYCRVYPSASLGATRRGFTVETWRSATGWDGHEWVADSYGTAFGGAWANEWNSGQAHVTGDDSGYSDPVVITNLPEVVVVRVAGESCLTTFSLRAADTWVEVTPHHRNTSTVGWGFRRATTEARTTFTGGMRATASDGNGLRYLASAPCTVYTHADGKIAGLPATAGLVTYQITADYQAGVVTTDTAVRDLFLAPRSDRRRVVPR